MRARRSSTSACGISTVNGLIAEPADLSVVTAICLPFLQGAFAEGGHPDDGEHAVSGAELLACVDASPGASQPLTVEQVRASELGPQRRAAEMVDRRAVAVLGGRVIAQQRLAAGFDAERKI